jgi:HSP20 family molecular chaperone IbpA
MSRMTLLDGDLWLSLSAERTVRGQAKGDANGYPPYNIELLEEGEAGSEAMLITLAVAGFKHDELEVSVEDGALTVRGKQREDEAKDYLHRGIVARQFIQTFTLANGVEVRKAELNSGLLAIELMRQRKENRVVKVGILAAD